MKEKLSTVFKDFKRLSTVFKDFNRLSTVFKDFKTRLAIDRSICILTRPVVNTGFNRSLLVDWWSIGQLKKPWWM